MNLWTTTHVVHTRYIKRTHTPWKWYLLPVLTMEFRGGNRDNIKIDLDKTVWTRIKVAQDYIPLCSLLYLFGLKTVTSGCCVCRYKTHTERNHHMIRTGTSAHTTAAFKARSHTPLHFSTVSNIMS
jgi:hypothetical protein